MLQEVWENRSALKRNENGENEQNGTFRTQNTICEIENFTEQTLCTSGADKQISEFKHRSIELSYLRDKEMKC